MNPCLKERACFSYLLGFRNLEILLQSHRICCAVCGRVFLYDGTEQTKPATIDGITGWCTECGHFSLIGDAVWELPQEELRKIIEARKLLRSEPDLPQLVRQLMEADGNAGILRQQKKAYCFSCREFFVLEWQMLTDAHGDPLPDSGTVICPKCLAPAVISEKSVRTVKKSAISE